MHAFIRRKDIPYILLTILLGCVSHFLYDFSEQNPFTALITPVNESVWEHLKLLFFPFFFSTCVQYYVIRPKKAAFFGSRLVGVLAGILSIIILFYLYTSVFGKDIFILDISIFIFSVLLSFYFSVFFYRFSWNVESLFCFLGWLISILIFFVFTCFPPELSIFCPPQI